MLPFGVVQVSRFLMKDQISTIASATAFSVTMLAGLLTGQNAEKGPPKPSYRMQFMHPDCS